jgi:hypothetical protein
MKTRTDLMCPFETHLADDKTKMMVYLQMFPRERERAMLSYLVPKFLAIFLLFIPILAILDSARRMNALPCDLKRTVEGTQALSLK